MSKIDERIEKAAKEYAEQESKIFSHKTAMGITFIQSKAGFIAGVEWALSHQWQSVDDEISESNDSVIVIYTDYLTGNECVGIASYDKINGEWYSADADIYINRHSIKYWMPIPPIPDAKIEKMID